MHVIGEVKMEKNDYKMEFEEQRKEIDLNDDEQVLSRVELHSKNKEKKNKTRSPFSLINVLLIIFTLIPIGIFAFVIINLNTSKMPIEPTPEDDGLQIIETNGKSNQDGGVVLDPDEEEQKKQEEQKEKEALAKAEEEKKAEEAKKAEEERKAEEARQAEEARKKEEQQREEARQKELARQQAEKEQAEANKNQSNSNGGGGKTHTVAPGETLYRISVNYYQNGDGVEKIKQANGLSSNSISVGQKLVIP